MPEARKTISFSASGPASYWIEEVFILKVLLLNGSPHENGSTRAALNAVAAELEKAELQTEFFQLGVKPIRGCIACHKCAAGRCVYNDDAVNRFLERMEQADALVIGSPVYYAAPNGELLALLNRAYYAGACFAHKPGAAVIVARRAGTTAALDVLNKYFTIKEMPVVSSQYWNMAHGGKAEDVAQDREGLQIMRTLARNMAWLLKCLEAGRLAGLTPPEREPWERTDFIR
jgi:multimeric flavodoxin WrbA